LEYPETLGGTTILPCEGLSLLPAFDNRPIEREFLAWEHEGNAAIRMGDWKLVRRGAAAPWELYNLAIDRTEMSDLAAAEPKRVSDLAAKWHSWAERCYVLPKPN
jgi:arylsulfatase